MAPNYQTFAELFEEEEEKRLAAMKAQDARDKAAYDALPQAEKDRIEAARQARWDAIADACADACADASDEAEGRVEDEDEDEDDEEENDDGND